jgi:hypothetical protein
LKATAPDEAYFWATHNGAELDLLLIKGGYRIGVECKRVDAPRLTPSMRAAVQDLELNRIFVIYPGYWLIQFRMRFRHCKLLTLPDLNLWIYSTCFSSNGAARNSSKKYTCAAYKEDKITQDTVLKVKIRPLASPILIKKSYWYHHILTFQ